MDRFLMILLPKVLTPPLFFSQLCDVFTYILQVPTSPNKLNIPIAYHLLFLPLAMFASVGVSWTPFDVWALTT